MANGYCENSSDFSPELNKISLNTSFYVKNEFSNICINRIYSTKTKIILNSDTNNCITINSNDEDNKLYLEMFTYQENNFTYLFIIKPKKQFEYYNSNKLISCDIIQNNIDENLF